MHLNIPHRRKREYPLRSRVYFSGVLLLLFASSTSAGTATTLDDIDYWVGQGANRAALVIDWDDSSTTDESLAWGYRWDGTATGEDMLLEVLAADDRLFAKLSTPSPSGVTLYGLGYDLDNNSAFSITDGTVFDSEGIGFSGPPDNPPPAAVSTDAADHYAEGWFTGFWHYGLGLGNPFAGGSWVDSGGGMSSRTLTDGDWDSWTFSPTFNFAAFAENPVAAAAPGPAADFNLDGKVDGADFLIWQRGFGIASGAMLAQGDADGNGTVDGNDLQLWSAEFGLTAAVGSASIAGATVPEPSSIGLLLWGTCLLLKSACHRRQ